ncbi:MAG: DnaB-like helicase N-terminal domain-containing protein, partial [Ruthenibacterium sp.]
PDGRVGYIKEAVNVLAGRTTATERDVYAGRIAEEIDVNKSAILNQIEAAVRARQKRDVKDREKRLLEEGAGGRINVPYSQGGQKALGVAFAEQQLIGAILKNPEYLAIAAARVKPENFISADMAKAYAVLLDKAQHKEYIDLAGIGETLPEETISLISRILAQNYDVSLSEQDVNLYLERIVNSTPESARAADKTPDELADYMQTLKHKKA